MDYFEHGQPMWDILHMVPLGTVIDAPQYQIYRFMCNNPLIRNINADRSILALELETRITKEKVKKIWSFGG